MDKIERLRHIILTNSFAYSEDGHFTLSSGEKSNFYFDCKKTSLDPEGSALIGEILYELVERKFQDIVGAGGLTLGADPLGAALMHHAWLRGRRINQFIAGKELKGHGSIKWIEGNVEPGDRVVVLDDVVTTGGSVIQAIDKSREDGLIVDGVIVLVDREEFGGMERVRQEVDGRPVESVVKRSEIMALYGQG